MVRKTVAINDNLFHNLESSQILEQYDSFSELVSTALKLLIEKERKNYYEREMLKASKDKLYIEDMKSVESDFKYSDFESIK